jgi:hypothetical protein
MPERSVGPTCRCAPDAYTVAIVRSCPSAPRLRAIPIEPKSEISPARSVGERKTTSATPSSGPIPLRARSTYRAVNTYAPPLVSLARWRSKRSVPETGSSVPALARVMMYRTISCATSPDNARCGGITRAPHTPLPPVTTLPASLAIVLSGLSRAPAYRCAIMRKLGPMDA